MTLTRYSVQFRSTVDGNTIRGHASVFNQLAKLPGHFERMDPGAFNEVLDRTDTDPRALINHDPSLVLGRRSAGTLRLKVDEEGLGFEVDLPDTSYANDLRALVARGDITGASFGFVPGTDDWSTVDGRQVRTHLSVAELVDVSVVTYPAYSGAEVALRSYDFSRTSLREQTIRARHRVRFTPRKG